MTDIHEPTVRPTAYAVSCVPEGNVNARHFTVRVEYRGRDLWAVTDGMFCLGRDGEWDDEPISSERDDQWLAKHRFELDDALALAKRQAPLMTVNGLTVADALKRGASRG